MIGHEREPLSPARLLHGIVEVVGFGMIVNIDGGAQGGNEPPGILEFNLGIGVEGDHNSGLLTHGHDIGVFHRVINRIGAGYNKEVSFKRLKR